MDMILVVFPVIMIMCGVLLLFFLLKMGSLKKELQISRKCFIMSFPRENTLIGIVLFLLSLGLTSVVSIHGFTEKWTTFYTLTATLTALFGFFSIVLAAVFSTFKIVVSKDMMYIYHVFRPREDISLRNITKVERELRRRNRLLCRSAKNRTKLKIYTGDGDNYIYIDETMTGAGVFVKTLEKNGISIMGDAS